MEVGFELLAVGTVHDDIAVLEYDDAGGDVDGVLQVVGADDDGGSSALLVVGEQMLELVLRRGVEEVERLVEDDGLRLSEECRHDAHLLLVACREVAYELLLSEDLRGVAQHVSVEGGGRLLAVGIVGYALDLGEELEVFLWGEVVDEEALVNIGAHVLFPLLALGGVDGGGQGRELVADGTLVGLEQVEEHAEEGGLSRSVVAH